MARQKLAAATRDLAALRVPAELAAEIDAFAEEAGSTQAQARRELYERGLAMGDASANFARRRAPRSAAEPPRERLVAKASRGRDAPAAAAPSKTCVHPIPKRTKDGFCYDCGAKVGK